MPISKTDFVRALQCPKMLWLDAHKPQFKIIPPEIQEKLDAGNEFGDKAMGIFGNFTETTTLKEDGKLFYAEMLRKTQNLLLAGETVICEAAFSWYGNYCAVDILKKEENGYALYEVKNAFTARKEFITDLGFQSLILRKSGVNICSCNLVLRGDGEPDNPNNEEQALVEYKIYDNFTYKLVDVSKAARQMERLAEKHIFEFGKLKKQDAECPNIPMGEHCNTPYACWYCEFCKNGE